MKILIIKIGALGDIVRTSFIAQALKDKYKKETPEIFWIVDNRATPLLSFNQYIDHIILKEDKETIKNLHFDIVINLEEDEENCKFASSLSSNQLIGFKYEERAIVPTLTAKEWFDMSALGKKPQNDTLKKKNKKTHRQILAEIVGVDSQKFMPFLRLTKKQLDFAKDFLRRYNLSRSELIIGINTGSADRWPKQLSIKKTIELIDNLHSKYNAKILLFGGPNEIERNRKILSLSHSPVIYTGSGNDLFEFPALISLCSLFITTDSLGLHLALAIKRKTISLLGPTSANEIDMYGLGDKIIAKSNCLCCYKKDCKSMEKIDLKEVLISIEKLLKQKITLVITAFKEPNIWKAIEAAITQKTKYSYDTLIVAPDTETLNIAKSYASKNKKVKILKDSGKGKSFSLNLVFKSIDSDILILTDGDVYISEYSIEEIANLFQNPEIGCVSGRPIPIEDRSNKFGYFANFLFESAHKIRKSKFELDSFLECSGYLFAFRKKEIKSIPLDVAEDAIIPYYFWEKGYKIGYAENAKVYVKNVDNIQDWIKQKTRTNKSHSKLDVYADTKTTRRVKTLGNEAKGIGWLLVYPRNLKEFFWNFELVFLRAYTWWLEIAYTRFSGKAYKDGWERAESTKHFHNI